MWIFTPNAFISIVAHKTKPNLLNVRGRIKNDIETLFPEAEVHEVTGTDYRFTAELKREDVADAIADALLMGTQYQSVRSAIPAIGRSSRIRASAMHKTWQAMLNSQFDDMALPDDHKTR